jgi:hypothetical protein
MIGCFRGDKWRIRSLVLLLQADEAISATRDGLQVALRAPGVGDSLAQGRHMHLDVVLLDDRVRPDLGHELVLRDDLAARGDQHTEDIERAASNRDRCVAAFQLPP